MSERIDQYEREEKARMAKAALAWETKYKDLKPIEKDRSTDNGVKCIDYVFVDWVKETDTEVKTKTTKFSIYSNGQIRMWTGTSKASRYPAIGGPLNGQVVTATQAGDDYAWYNCGESDYGSENPKNAPKCLFIHKSQYKATK